MAGWRLRLALGMVAVVAAAGASSFPLAKSDPARKACETAQSFIKDRLRTPATAEFQKCGEEQTTQDDDLFYVSTYVDAQNVFGAKVRSYYLVDIRYREPTWELVKLTEVQEHNLVHSDFK